MKKWKIGMLALAIMIGAAWRLDAAEKPDKRATVTFKVNVHCDNCKLTLEKHIPFEKGVIDMQIDIPKQTVQIRYDSGKTNETKLKSAIEKLGFRVQKTNERGAFSPPF